MLEIQPNSLYNMQRDILMLGPAPGCHLAGSSGCCCHQEEWLYSHQRDLEKDPEPAVFARIGNQM